MSTPNIPIPCYQKKVVIYYLPSICENFNIKPSLQTNKNTPVTLSSSGCSSFGIVSWYKAVKNADGNIIEGEQLVSLTVNPQVSTYYIAKCSLPDGASCSKMTTVHVYEAQLCTNASIVLYGSYSRLGSYSLKHIGCENGEREKVKNSVLFHLLELLPRATTNPPSTPLLLDWRGLECG